MLIQPPNFETVDGPVVFLAGPIQGAPQWQYRAYELLTPGTVVACPRQDYKEKGIEFVYNTQVDWETHYLNHAGKNGVVLFYLAAQTIETPGRSYAQTTRFELGEWIAKCALDETINLVVGAEEGFGNLNYITRRLSQSCGLPVYAGLAETVAAAQAILDTAS